MTYTLFITRGQLICFSRSGVKGQGYMLSIVVNLVNKIQTELFELGAIKLWTHTYYDKRGGDDAYGFQGQGSIYMYIQHCCYILLTRYRPTIWARTWHKKFLWQEDDAVCFSRSGVKGQSHMLSIVKPSGQDTECTIWTRMLKLGVHVEYKCRIF